MSSVDEVCGLYQTTFLAEPQGVWAAPGRVNLIGEHTDYNEGFVLPFALAQRALVAAARKAERGWTFVSAQLGETVEVAEDALVPGLPGWAAYLAGVVWALRTSGHTVDGGGRMVLSSDVPLGAGLSSSAALECAAMAALCDLFGLEIEPIERAKLSRKVENEFVGAPTGLMDQAASTLCQAHRALFMDCRTLGFELVDLPLSQAGLEAMVLDTHTPHAHVDGEYADRRRACDRAADLLRVRALRDVEDLAGALARIGSDQVLVRRVRHVVTENQRVLDAVVAARAADFASLAKLMDASHVSMRDDFEITVPTVDTAVEAARAAGAVGARMTGGGFGGCIVALVPAGATDAVGGAVADAFGRRGFAAPTWFVASPSQGAARVH